MDKTSRKEAVWFLMRVNFESNAKQKFNVKDGSRIKNLLWILKLNLYVDEVFCIWKRFVEFDSVSNDHLMGL